MNESHDSTATALSQATVPPLSAALRRRTLAMARGNLRTGASHRASRVLLDYTPPKSLVPSLLVSAGAAFLVDAAIKIARIVRFLCIS
jgi:hypothetical protein